jgi:hypothetical protein
MTDPNPEKKRGPRGGIKHTPGRGHARKSDPIKKRRHQRKTARQRNEEQEEARRLWHAYDQLSNELKKLLGPSGEPKVPRPKA